MSTNPTIDCAVCGHQMPAASLRGRSFVTCNCGAVQACADDGLNPMQQRVTVMVLVSLFGLAVGSFALILRF